MKEQVYLASTRGRRYQLAAFRLAPGEYEVIEYTAGNMSLTSCGHDLASCRREIERRFLNAKTWDNITYITSNDALFSCRETWQPQKGVAS